VRAVSVGSDEVVVRDTPVIASARHLTVPGVTADPAAGGHAADKLRMSAHIRTAAMLSVVTVVFVLTFAPAFLMSLDIVLYSRPVFYVYFFNNVANPIIYSFMNNYFRRELNAMFCNFDNVARR